MGKKLEGNGLLESSRMILPEHKEAILEHRRNIGKPLRPVLDEQHMEWINEVLQQAREVEKTFLLFGKPSITGNKMKIAPLSS